MSGNNKSQQNKNNDKGPTNGNGGMFLQSSGTIPRKSSGSSMHSFLANNGATSNNGQTNSSSNNLNNVTEDHPYDKGSVIEVLWKEGKNTGRSRKKKDANVSFAEFLADLSSEDDNEESSSCARLCDVIDYEQVKEKEWMYYVHYRDFNRRMDEWVTSDRILSSPTLAAIKLKAMLGEDDISKQQHQNIQTKRKRSASSNAEFAPFAENSAENTSEQRLTRRQKRKNLRSVPSEDETASVHSATKVDVVATIAPKELDEHEGLDEASLREHEEVTKLKNVSQVQLGQYRMDAWYFSPIPKDFIESLGKSTLDVLYVCEFSFNFFARLSELRRFHAKAGLNRHPPGNEIYRNGNLSMFEVNGSEERIYCQNLCYIAKLFLDHKTLYYDVDPFLFYVLCESDNRGFHPVGYFSKEKYSDVGYNLACILTFPAYQRKGYGRFLISFSYELSKLEEKVGSPEKPMSDLGQQAYKPYWTATIVDFLRYSDNTSLSIMDISKRTSILVEDIIFTLNQLGILKFINGIYFCSAEESTLEQLSIKYPIKTPKVNPSRLHWTPFLTDVKRDKFSIHSKKPSVEKKDDPTSLRSGANANSVS